MGGGTLPVTDSVWGVVPSLSLTQCVGVVPSLSLTQCVGVVPSLSLTHNVYGLVPSLSLTHNVWGAVLSLSLTLCCYTCSPTDGNISKSTCFPFCSHRRAPIKEALPTKGFSKGDCRYHFQTTHTNDRV